MNLYLGAGIMLVSCVSGAQLSNYATFLTDPHMAPLSIVMTSLSTATAVFVTPTLSYFLIGQKLPVDVKGMMSSIVQIVVAPIAAGLLLNRYSLHCSEVQGTDVLDWIVVLLYFCFLAPTLSNFLFSMSKFMLLDILQIPSKALCSYSAISPSVVSIYHCFVCWLTIGYKY